ncbi:MAG: ROK family protein [Butyricicoccaceae bacterium]
MKPYCFGVDIGGTSVKIGLFQTDGRLIQKSQIRTRTENSGAEILSDIAAELKRLCTEHRMDAEQIAGVGVGIPGPVSKKGVVHGCVNLGWGERDVSGELSGLTGWAVAAGNDANVAALGEQWLGAGRAYQSIVMVTLGTGVGGGIVYEGKILPGSHGAAGEIGHMGVLAEESHYTCGCGKHDCVEITSSANGLVRVAQDVLAESDAPSAMRELEILNAKDICAQAAEGDALAHKAVNITCDRLGAMMANVACVIDPEAFVIGGGMAAASELLFPLIEQSYQKRVFPNLKGLPILAAELGNDAGICGAAKMILTEL